MFTEAVDQMRTEVIFSYTYMQSDFFFLNWLSSPLLSISKNAGLRHFSAGFAVQPLKSHPCFIQSTVNFSLGRWFHVQTKHVFYLVLGNSQLTVYWCQMCLPSSLLTHLFLQICSHK